MSLNNSLHLDLTGHDVDNDGDIGTTTGNESFMVLSSTGLWILIPGCGFFYSGMAQSKSAMSMIILSLWSMAIVTIQWFLFGYSLAFSTSSKSLFIGNFQKALFIGVGGSPYPTALTITELSFCFYQGVTATLPTSLICGVLAERARILPALLFIFLWTTFVYCPASYWKLNPNGWSFKLGRAAALAYSFVLGPRNYCDRIAKPHSMLNIMIGTVLIWFGSFGYNAGSASGASYQAVRSCIVTNLSGSMAAITWSALDYIQAKKCSGFGLCAGAVVGLIIITPASGLVNPLSSIVFGMSGTLICRWGHNVKKHWKFDDTLDVFAMHGLAGIVGMILTGIFAQKIYGGAEVTQGGWLDGHWLQVPIQCADMLAGFTWSFLFSFGLLFLMNKTSLLKLRVQDRDPEQVVIMNLNNIEENDSEGVDILEMGMPCYEHIEQIRYTKDAQGESLKWAMTVTNQNHKQRDVDKTRIGNEQVNDWQNYWM